MRFQVLSLLFLFFGIQAFSLEPIRFGPEFTFMAFGENANIPDLVHHIINHVTVDQPVGAKFVYRRDGMHYRETLRSPNGWMMSFYQDSGGLEVLTNPMTVADFKKYKSDIQDAIFASASVKGYFPALWQGGGHINIDVTNFEKNPMLFRNFVVDLLNHNELFMGIFEFNAEKKSVAIPHELMSSNISAALNMIEISRRNHSLSFHSMVETFQQFLKGSSFAFNKIWDDRRFEIRAVRPQASMDVWIHQIELFESRLKYLERFRGPIPYAPRVPWQESSINGKPPVDPQAAMKSFYVYVRESGLKWQDHRDYLWPLWVQAQEGETQSEREKFEASEWFKAQENSLSCENRLIGAGQ